MAPFKLDNVLPELPHGVPSPDCDPAHCAEFVSVNSVIGGKEGDRSSVRAKHLAPTMFNGPAAILGTIRSLAETGNRLH